MTKIEPWMEEAAHEIFGHDPTYWQHEKKAAEIMARHAPPSQELVKWAEQVVEFAESRKFILGMESVAISGRAALAAYTDKEG